MAGKCSERKRLNELACGLRHHHLHRTPAVLQCASELGSLVGRDTATYSQDYAHNQMFCASVSGSANSASRMRSSYCTRPLRTSSIAATVGFRDVLGRNERAPF